MLSTNEGGWINKEATMVSYAGQKLASRHHALPRASWWCLLIAPLLAGAASPAASSITISVFLLSSETGRLSPDAMMHPDLLGNAVAGAASAHAALVRVKVAVRHGAPLPSGARVRLVARVSGARAIVGGAKGEAGRVVLDRTVRLGPAGADGDAYAGFWLDGVGCTPKERDAKTIAADLMAAGVDLDMATRAAGGSGLSGAAADRYVKDHHDEVDVGLDEQILLNVHDERRMERMVQNRINVPLHQYELDALVSYAAIPARAAGPRSSISSTIMRARRPWRKCVVTPPRSATSVATA